MYKTIIGLEIHIEQKTNSKVFCKCPADHFAKAPNTQTCPTCLGLPGALPYLNQEALTNTLLFGLALHCEVAFFSKFDRKHYFYPDLPKGFQISQYDLPLTFGGKWTSLSDRVIGIKRIHLEEDTAKLVHTDLEGEDVSLIDFNRSGVPLIELVTGPDFEKVEEVVEFTQEIQRIVRFLNISDADMEKGSMRLEANISVAPANLPGLPDYKVELKNINSFKFMEKALISEIERQQTLLEAGQKPIQETRGFDEKTASTFSQRTKEEAMDYRYFPEPDLPPVRFTDIQVEELRATMPELPSAKRLKYKTTFELADNFVDFLTSAKATADYFETAVDLATAHNVSAKVVADMIVNRKAMQTYAEPALLIKKLVGLQKQAFANSEDIKLAVEKVLSNQSQAVSDFKSGKEQVVGFLIGLVQKELKGTGEISTVRSLLLAALQR